MDPKWIKSNYDKMCIFQILSIRSFFPLCAVLCDLAAMAVDQMAKYSWLAGIVIAEIYCIYCNDRLRNELNKSAFEQSAWPKIILSRWKRCVLFFSPISYSIDHRWSIHISSVKMYDGNRIASYGRSYWPNICRINGTRRWNRSMRKL